MCINYPHTHIYLYTHAGEDGALAVYSSGVPASQPIICPLMGAWGAWQCLPCTGHHITVPTHSCATCHSARPGGCSEHRKWERSESQVKSKQNAGNNHSKSGESWIGKAL